MPDDAYDPASIRILAGMEPPRRPAGFVQDSPEGRVALSVEDLTAREMVLIMASEPVGPDYSLDDIPDDPVAPGGDACAPEVVSDPAVMSGDPVVAGTRVPALTILAYLRAGYSDRDIHEDYPTLPPGSVDAVRIWAEHRYPVEDGPGSGQSVELTVRVLVGLERSTVIVADPFTGRALTREVLPHGREADVAAAAVEAAIRARLTGEPGGVPGGVPEPLGEPHE